ncbi:hypothetical protein FQZ97_858900 [compost metagenome]
MGDRRGLLDLGHEEGLALDQLTGLEDVLGALDERQGDPVDPQVQAEVQVAAILLGQWAELQHRFGHVDALAIRQFAAGDYFGKHRVGLFAGHLQAQATVVEQQAHARLQRLDDFRVRQVDPAGVARGAVQVQAKGLAALQIDLAGGKAADPQFRPLQVHEDADRHVQLLLHFAHPGVALGVVGVFAVAEVEAEQIDPGLDQLTDIVDACDGRAEGGEDFHFFIWSHWAGLSRIRMARKSLMLVRVGPVWISASRAAK